MSVIQVRVFWLNSSRKGPVNLRPLVDRYENTGFSKLPTGLLRISGFSQWRCHSECRYSIRYGYYDGNARISTVVSGT